MDIDFHTILHYFAIFSSSCRNILPIFLNMVVSTYHVTTFVKLLADLPKQIGLRLAGEKLPEGSTDEVCVCGVELVRALCKGQRKKERPWKKERGYKEGGVGQSDG